MKVVIIEDEFLSQRYLADLIKKNFPTFEILAMLDSIDLSIDWLSNNTIDLIFMDVTLSDGDCSRILDSVKIKSPIIFTTALINIDYLIKRFDKTYLLNKPIRERELKNIVNSILGIDHMKNIN